MQCQQTLEYNALQALNVSLSQEVRLGPQVLLNWLRDLKNRIIWS